MVIIETKAFIKEFNKLPKNILKLLNQHKSIFQKNWLDPRLHTKRVKELPGVYSLRLTRRYRVLFYFKDDQAIFFSIGHRKDIYD